MSEQLGFCPTPNARTGSGCKRRDCPVCGVRWARDWRRSMEQNLERYGRPVVLISITAPGEDRLPWDTDCCSHRRRHKHRGPDGCRVQQRPAREWADTVTYRWQKLRQAAAIATERLTGAPPVILERVWEPQKRGVPHLHIVLGYGTPSEIDRAHCFAAQLAERASSYDFGFVDAKKDASAPWGRRLRPIAAKEAARYLSAYLTGRSKRKNSIRENIADPIMPRSLIWLTPKLTSKEEAITASGRPTFITMRTIRRARHLYAYARGICDPPVWQSMAEAAKVAIVCRVLFGPRRSGSADEPSADAALAFAVKLERTLGPFWKRKAYEEERYTYRRRATALGDQINSFWCTVAGLEMMGAAA